MLRTPVRPLLVLLVSTALSTACDKGLQPEPICASDLIGVCGTIRFRGTVPDSTDNVFVAAYAAFPQTCNELITNRQPFIPGSVSYTDSVSPYGVTLPPRTYAWVLAVWKKVGTLTLTPADTALLRVAGYYRNPADTTQPGSVIVPNGGAAANINFRVEFDSLRPATDFVSCTAQ
jgi:hypothetical protein